MPIWGFSFGGSMKSSGQVKSESKDLANRSMRVRVSATGLVEFAVSGIKLAIGAPDKTLCDRVRQNALAVSDLADIVSESSQIIRGGAF
jgi:hypothetical protein